MLQFDTMIDLLFSSIMEKKLNKVRQFGWRTRYMLLALSVLCCISLISPFLFCFLFVFVFVFFLSFCCCFFFLPSLFVSCHHSMTIFFPLQLHVAIPVTILVTLVTVLCTIFGTFRLLRVIHNRRNRAFTSSLNLRPRFLHSLPAVAQMTRN